MAKTVSQLQTELDELNNKYKEATRLIESYLDQTDRDDLCSDGQSLYDDACKLVDRRRTVDKYISFSVNSESVEFELEPDDDETDTYNYEVVLYYNDNEIWRGSPDDVSFS